MSFKLLSKNALAIITFILGVSIGMGAGYFTNFNPVPGEKIASRIYPIRTNETAFQFINPLLSYELPPGEALGESLALSGKIENIIDGFTSINPNASASVYFQDLNSGRWFGIEESHKYTPASLMKVIVMIAYFRDARLNPNRLDEEIFYTEEIQLLSQTIPYDPGTKLVLNEGYKISDLIERMIADSDNGATYALMQEINKDILAQVYHDLHIDAPPEQGRDFTLSVKDYALLFRVLYNSTYINRVMSEQALTLLSKTEYKDGMTALLDPGTKVAHKYGEAVTMSQGGRSSEMHDCGIVYYPEKPYVLCIMTHGQNRLHLAGLIQQISKTVYDDVKTTKEN